MSLCLYGTLIHYENSNKILYEQHAARLQLTFALQNERRRWVAKIIASYSEGPSFKYRLVDQLSWLTVFVVFLKSR
jgi:hypothetical protein